MIIFAQLSDVTLGPLTTVLQLFLIDMFTNLHFKVVKENILFFLDPACLELDLDFHCFVAEKNCQKR